MALDKRGDIAVGEVIAYIPILVIGLILVLRYGFTKKAGWLYLVILSILRIVGGVTHILSETTYKTSVALRITYGICESSGTSPLLLATMGFLQAAGAGALDNHFIMNKGVKLASLVCTVGLILGIVGGVKAGEAKTQSDINEGTKYRRIGVALFVVVYAFDVLFYVVLWSARAQLLMNRRKFLTRISFALPFLSIRVLYSVLSAFAPNEEKIGSNGQITYTSSDSGLEKFSSTTGSWALFLLMSVGSEFVAVVIFAVTGMVTPLDNDYAGTRAADWDADGPEEMAKLNKPAAYDYAPYAPGQSYAAPAQPYAAPAQPPYVAPALTYARPYAPQPYSQ